MMSSLFASLSAMTLLYRCAGWTGSTRFSSLTWRRIGLIWSEPTSARSPLKLLSIWLSRINSRCSKFVSNCFLADWAQVASNSPLFPTLFWMYSAKLIASPICGRIYGLPKAYSCYWLRHSNLLWSSLHLKTLKTVPYFILFKQQAVIRWRRWGGCRQIGGNLSVWRWMKNKFAKWKKKRTPKIPPIKSQLPQVKKIKKAKAD